MRVLMVTLQLPTEHRPGTLAPVARQIESLRALGVDVDVLQITGSPKLKYAAAVPRLRSRARSADLVHAHFGYCGWAARSQLSRPLVVSFMGSDLLGTSDARGRVTRWSRPVVAANRSLARLVDAVIVKSPQMAAVVARAGPQVIPNGVDTARFRPLDRVDARNRLGWSSEDRYVLFAGNPGNPRKAYPIARAAVDRAAAALGGSDEIRMVPLSGIDPDLVPAYLSAADALVMTSHWEGSPNVVKEAMACNLPVVSVPVGDVPQLLEGVEASTVCPRDPVALAEALADVLEQPRRSDGRRALERKGLGLERVARAVANVYEQVLTRRDGSRAA
jgi:glycosyltransferase involved in cell wall biosynthesis